MIVESGPVSDSEMETQLPPLSSVDTMSQVQLTEFIPDLVCMATGRQHPYFGKIQFKPEWWPDSVAWRSPGTDTKNTQALQIEAQELRTVIRSCYKHLGQENLLGDAAESNTMLRVTTKINKDDGIPETSASQEASIPHTVDKSQESVEDPIWICFLCAKQFVNQDELMIHQDRCEQETADSDPPPSSSTIYKRKLHPKHHDFLRPRQNIQFQPQPVKLVCHRKRVFTPEPYSPPTKEDFVKALNLSDKPKHPPRVATPVSDIDSDCEIVDVTFDASAVKTPRTPKSLMSQLSRDIENSARRRHLSFSHNLEPPEEYSSDNSDSESESGSQKNKPKLPFGTLLCAIPLTSPLGQRVKKHWKIETNYSIISEDKIEAFCSGPMKNDFVEKLRHRGEISYPIVFNKKNRKHMGRHKHDYKFNSQQRKEFMIRLKTGLSKRSRKFLTEIVECSVKLERLKPCVIKRWVKRKPPPPYPYAYIRRMFEQEHPIIKKIIKKPILGPKYAKLKQISDGLRKLNRPHNLLPNQRVVTKMIQNQDGTSSMRMMCTPSTVPRPQFSNAGNNRRKQTFDQNTVRHIDPGDIEIIELSSSDEEEEAVQIKPPQTAVPPVRMMTHYKNITGVPNNSFQQSQRMPFSSNMQKVTSSYQQPLTGLNNFPKQDLPGQRSASPSETRTRIFQGMKGLLSPSSMQIKSGISIHSSPTGGSTCKETLPSSKPASGMLNRAIFKDSPPQILRKSISSPVKLMNKSSLNAANFPGYNQTNLNEQTSLNLGIQKNSVAKVHPSETRHINGSPLPQKISSTPAESKPRDPIMESEVIVIDDD